jgi:WD40 repeat protein
MFRWLVITSVICFGSWFGISWLVGPKPWSDERAEARENGPARGGPEPVERKLTWRLAESDRAGGGAVPIVIPDARLLIIEKQEVAAQRDGVLLFIARPIRPGEKLDDEKKKKLMKAFLPRLAAEVEVKSGQQPPADAFKLLVDGKETLVRRWDPQMPMLPGKLVVYQEETDMIKLDVGDDVLAGELLALVDPRIAIDDLKIKLGKYASSEKAKAEAIALREETRVRYERLRELKIKNGENPDDEETRERKLAWDRTTYSAEAKLEEMLQAKSEVNAAQTILEMHQVKAVIPGKIKAIYAFRGFAVKQLEPVLLLEHTKKLRVEGMVGIEHTQQLEKWMEQSMEPGAPEHPVTVTVEATRPSPPRFILSGHTAPVTCVAVSKGPNPVVISGSEDRGLWGWNSETGKLLWRFDQHPAAVRSLACSPVSTGHNLAVAGLADGSVWIYDLKQVADAMRETGKDGAPPLPTRLEDKHMGAVNSIAFSPDGLLVATAGDDRSIQIWNAESRKLLHRIVNSHRGPVTSVHFSEPNKLISAGRDNTLVVWDVSNREAPVRDKLFDHRSGDVGVLNSSNNRVLVDEGKLLRIQSLKDNQVEGILVNAGGADNFSTMALFAPDGKTILTNSAGEGHLQLWRTPLMGGRGAEARHFVWQSGEILSGAYSPDSKFIATGTQDHKVLVWEMPSLDEVEKRIPARISFVERSLESSTLKARIWADLEEHPSWLIPGTTATVVINPPK